MVLAPADKAVAHMPAQAAVSADMMAPDKPVEAVLASDMVSGLLRLMPEALLTRLPVPAD